MEILDVDGLYSVSFPERDASCTGIFLGFVDKLPAMSMTFSMTVPTT